jgi:eukaryotic-like serine/threonine-protein kinase
MALTGRECGHQYRPDVRFCIVCGADQPEPIEPAPAYQPTQFYQPAPVYQAAPALYRPLAAPPVPSRVLPGPPGPPPDRPRRLRGLLIGLATFLAAGGITAAVMLIAHPLQRGAAPSPGGTASAPASPGAQPAHEAAAQGLAGLLAQSVTDRSSIVAAVNDVSQCGPHLNQDPRTFQSAVTSRQALLTRLASLPGRSVLPAPMLAALTSAWRNSIKADQDFALWAQDEISNGCTSNNQSSDPHAQAAAGPDAQATTGKQAFVGQWNPIATRYGLPTYRWNQL